MKWIGVGVELKWTGIGLGLELDKNGVHPPHLPRPRGTEKVCRFRDEVLNAKVQVVCFSWIGIRVEVDWGGVELKWS